MAGCVRQMQVAEMKGVRAVFRKRIFHRHRMTCRVCCPKDRFERGVGNVSIEQCKGGCKDAVRVEEKGVWCSFGQNRKETTGK